MQFENDKFTITVSGRTIKCNLRKEPMVRKTTITKDGVTVKDIPFTQMFNAPVQPYFTADYGTASKDFDVDLDCGAQRWHGRKSTADVRKALKLCGFTPTVIKQIMREVTNA